MPVGLWCQAGSGADRALLPVPVKLVETIREVDLLVEELEKDDVVFFKPGFSTSVTPLTVIKIDVARLFSC